MLIVDNTSKLKDIMEFQKGSYYKFVCLIRAKDFRDNPEAQPLHCLEKQKILVKDWLVDTPKQLEETLPDMLKFTEMFNCRLYMCTDRKSTLKTLKTMRDSVQKYLDPFLGNTDIECSVRAIKKIASSATRMDESSDKEGRRWLFDIDTKDEFVLKFVEEVCGEHFLSTFETKSGFHVIAEKKFDVRGVLDKYNDCVEVKSNAMVLVAMGG